MLESAEKKELLEKLNILRDETKTLREEMNILNSKKEETFAKKSEVIRNIREMITKVKAEIKQFKYRIAPHEIMKDEYPDKYYKFRSHKVAYAFFMETLGHQIEVKQL